MELLQEVANIAGKPGLFRIIKPGRAGVIVETLDQDHKREMVSASAKVSVLKEISIYTEDINKSIPLSEIFMTMKEQLGENIGIDTKTATPKQLFDFFEKNWFQKVFHFELENLFSPPSTLFFWTDNTRKMLSSNPRLPPKKSFPKI